jgi:YHS domain-containing protein
MKLDEGHIKESLVYKGLKYYFCSVGCRAEFQGHPSLVLESFRAKDRTEPLNGDGFGVGGVIMDAAVALVQTYLLARRDSLAHSVQRRGARG